MYICQYRQGYAAVTKGTRSQWLKRTKIYCSLMPRAHTGRQGSLLIEATQETRLKEPPPVCHIQRKERESDQSCWSLNLPLEVIHGTFVHISLSKAHHCMAPLSSTETGRCGCTTDLKVGRTRNIGVSILLTTPQGAS